jgi:SPP1 gp7 family putative phage head morphogenesis protein
MDGVMAGRTAPAIADELVRRAGVVESRALLIARDQVGKFHGELQRLRSVDAGCVAYIWSTSRDERVRRSHQMREGKQYRWDSPPSGGDHPGFEVGCRCCGCPIPDVEDEPVEAEARGGVFGWLRR